MKPQLSVLAVAVCLASMGMTIWVCADEGTPSTKSPPAGIDPVDFAADVKPILSDKCFHCHGPDPHDRKADLRFDVPQADQHLDEPPIVPGNRGESLFWQRITDKEDPMPPADSHKNLSPEEIEILGRWIDQGAEFESHWAYSPIKTSEPSTGAQSVAPTIDQFLDRALQKHRLQPSAKASPVRLVRRLYLDLIGLPPTPEEAAAYLADPTDQNYAILVDRLLDDTRFGEHWASWWLDLVRYGDSIGFHGDNAKAMWPYRDWVIRAFNNNLGFDEFTRLQLAGDLIARQQAEPDQDAVIASAYNRLSLQTAEFGAQPKEYRAIHSIDRVANFGEVWLAASTSCAQCHDHKYDPISAHDFYSLAAVFEDLAQPLVSNEKKGWVPFVLLPQTDDQKSKSAEVIARYRQITTEHPEAIAYEVWRVSRARGRQPKTGSWKSEFDKVLGQREALAKSIATIPVSVAMGRPREQRMLPRGNWMDESGEVVQPRPPSFLGGKEHRPPERFDRLDLANWLFEPDNPLTGRVVVNRLWAQMFGRGISSNTLDLGNQGDPPTHRELLDWLADSFRQSGWDMKKTIRQMALSRAYQQSSNQPAELVEFDPDNLWFARQSAVRLKAEVLRDQALATSGLLINRVGGPSSFPYQPEGHWDAINFPERKYPQSRGEGLYRRSVYTWVQRTFPNPMMSVFDAPNRETCVARRSRSNTPLQSLTLLNAPQYVEAARKLAENVMLKFSGEDDRLTALFRQVLLRPPTGSELALHKRLLVAHRTEFSQNPARAKAFIEIGDSPHDSSLPAIELASYASIGRVLLNIHETVTRP